MLIYNSLGGMNRQDMNFYLENEPEMKDVLLQLRKESGHRFVDDPLQEIYWLAGDHAEELKEVFENIFVINP